MFNDTKLTDGGELTLKFVGKNIIEVLNLGQKTFFKAFGASNKLVFGNAGDSEKLDSVCPTHQGNTASVQGMHIQVRKKRTTSEERARF